MGKFMIAESSFPIDLRRGVERAQASSEIETSKSQICNSHASSSRNLVRLGPGLGLSRHHPVDGDGKLDLSGPERAGDTAGGVSGGGGEAECLRSRGGGNIWLV